MRSSPCSVALLTALSLFFAAAGFAESPRGEARPKLRGLHITGGCCHDYDRQKLIITEGLSQRVSIEWDIVHEGSPDDRTYQISIYNNPNWSRGYDVVLHSECFGSVEDVKFVERIVQGHAETGIPAIFVHCSMHTYRAAQTDEWRKLIGVTSRRHEKGGAELLVKPVATDDPIMKGFPSDWTTPGDELYVVENLWPDCVPLAVSFGVETKREHPVIWKNTYGKARCFATSLGHNNLTMSSDVWLDCVARGLLWSVDRLNPDGTPAAGYAGTGKAPFSFEANRKTGTPTEAKRK